MNSRKGFLPVVMLSAGLLGACTSIGSSGVTSPTGTQSSVMFGGSVPYVVGKRRFLVDADYLDRYVCADGRPMVCVRSSRLATDLMCTCY
jgi:hypothetical protein